jgi:threonine dehydrogenase-like Zn-dependent dehydrogenase
MSAAVLSAPRLATLEQRSLPECRPNEVLVKVSGCGVCASSLPLWEGRPWFDYPLEAGAPGHEAWGIEVDSGRRVALLSRRGFAEYDAVPRDRIVTLPPELGDAPFPGEALACAMNIFERADIRAAETVAVVGAGFLGLLLVQLCVDAGAGTLAFTRRASSLSHARAFGAETPTEPQHESCDVVIEAAGVQEALDLAASLCRIGGRLIIAGYHQDGRRSVDMQMWNWRGLEVRNAHERDPAAYLHGMRSAVAAVVAGRLTPQPLYTHVLPLDGLGEAFELLHARPEGFVKALVVTE